MLLNNNDKREGLENPIDFSMGSKSDKTNQKRLFKRYSTLSENYASDSEFVKYSTNKTNYSSVVNTPTKLKRFESFTPYSKIPAIGQKVSEFKNLNNRFMLNYHSDNDSVRSFGALNSKIPVFRSPVPNKNILVDDLSRNLGLKKSHLARRNTYVVLEPVVCVKNEDEMQPRPVTRPSLDKTYTKFNKKDNPFNTTYTKFKQSEFRGLHKPYAELKRDASDNNNNRNDINGKSIVFGPKLFNAFESDSDVSAGDEMSPSSSEKEVKTDKSNLNTLNYLLNNLKLSRNTESDLLLPKNNPWLL